MNATSLYVSTSRLVFQSDGINDQNWTDLYRLVPYLRQSLSCTVCGCLLIEPYTPADIHCQHHVCRLCLGGRKNLKPTCSWCKDYEKYEENIQLRILLQCYKSLCEHIIATPMYGIIRKQSQAAGLLTNGMNIPNSSLVEFLEEGAKFQDSFKSKAGLSRSAYSILPCVFPNPNQSANKTTSITKQPTGNIVTTSVGPDLSSITQPLPIKTVSNGSAMYSVLHTGIGNKITIKRKTDKEEDFNNRKFQNIIRPKSLTKRRGCRCGNATATPGKLTCCGQRCPCYVDSKSCIDCKCRGCRNPHRPDGGKIRPHIPELACYEIQMADESTNLSPPNLTTTANNCLELLNDEFGVSRITSVKNTSLPFTNQIRQPLSIENIARESLLISSPEGSFQVVNVFTSPHQTTNFQQHHLTHHHTLGSTHHNHSRQMPEISTTLPQILMQQQDPSSISPTTDILSSAATHSNSMSTHHSSIALSSTSSLNPNTIAISPIIVTSSSPFPSQIFSEEEIITTQCSPPSSMPPAGLIDLVVSTEQTSSDSLHV